MSEQPPWTRLGNSDPTPSLAEFQRLQAEDDNLWWQVNCGHHLNLFEAATERVAELERELAALRQRSMEERGDLQLKLRELKGLSDVARSAVFREAADQLDRLARPMRRVLEGCNYGTEYVRGIEAASGDLRATADRLDEEQPPRHAQPVNELNIEERRR